MDIEALANLTLSQLLADYRAGRADPREVMELTLAQLEAVNRRLNAVYEVDPGAALAAAEQAAARYRAGTPTGALEGIPTTVKDSIHTDGMHWHHGSRAHGEGVLATQDAPPAERLKAAGAIIIGKCAMPDFGLSGSGVSSFHGIVKNPWSLSCNPGGSSAGAGASLAAGIAMASVGSDIAGSVRLPAAHCGLAALKPTQGMIPHTPASDVRSAGPMCRAPADLELLLRVLGGVHPDDRFSVPVIEPPEDDDCASATVHLYPTFGFGPAVEPAVADALARAGTLLADLVARISERPPPYSFDAMIPIDDSLRLRGWREYESAPAGPRDSVPDALVDWFSPARSWDWRRVAEFEAGIAAGVAVTNALFVGVDFLLTPVMPVVTFPADALGVDPAMPLRHCTFTAPFNQSGHPAVAIRGGFDSRGLPIGIQLVGKRFDDVRLLRLATALAARLEDDTDWPLEPRA